jgi:hypothetical protein
MDAPRLGNTVTNPNINREVVVRDLTKRNNLDRLLIFNRDDFSDVPLDYRHNFISLPQPRE